MLTNFRMGSFEVLMSLVIHRPSLRVVGQKLRVKHVEARLALRPRMTTTATSGVLGEAYSLFQKVRMDLHRQTLPSPKLSQLSKSWQIKHQPRSKG